MRLPTKFGVWLKGYDGTYYKILSRKGSGYDDGNLCSYVEWNCEEYTGEIVDIPGPGNQKGDIILGDSLDLYPENGQRENLWYIREEKLY